MRKRKKSGIVNKGNLDLSCLNTFHAIVNFSCPAIHPWAAPVSNTLPSATVKLTIIYNVYYSAAVKLTIIYKVYYSERHLGLRENQDFYMCESRHAMPRNNSGSEVKVRGCEPWLQPEKTNKGKSTHLQCEKGSNSLGLYLELFNMRTIEKYVFGCLGTSKNRMNYMLTIK